MRLCARSLAVFMMLISTVSSAKKAELVITWPEDNPTLRLAFGAFQNMGSYAGKTSLISDVVVQNLTGKVIPRASFNVSLFDKNNIRIGTGRLVIDDLNPA